MKKNEIWGERAERQRANSSSYWGLTQWKRLRSINRPCGWWGEHTHTNTHSEVLRQYPYSSSSQTAGSHWQRENTFVHLQYDEVFWSVWLKCKFLTVENFESISFASLSVDFRWFDGDREQACVLHSEGSFESEVWLLDFCLWNKGILLNGQ